MAALEAIKKASRNTTPLNLPEDRKRRAIRYYFGDQGSIMPWVLIGAGVLLLQFSKICLLLIGFGIFLLVRRKTLTSDTQIDRWTEEDFTARDDIARARDLAGLGELVRAPILLRGASDDALGAGVVNAMRVGKDGFARSTPLSATVILCTADQLGIYQAGVDLTTGNRVNERVLEVFYQDVVAVGMAAVTESLDTKGMISNLQFTSVTKGERKKGITRGKLIRNVRRLADRFRADLIADVLQRDMRKVYRIDFSDGESVRIPVADGRPTRRANSELDIEVGVETARAMAALRNFVREKKRVSLHTGNAAPSGPLV